jgi:iron-sulfur cluster repair protein YtfE (RIC family)
MSTLADEETPQGQALFQELLWVHDHVRRDLETVRRLAVEHLAGEVRDEVAALKAGGPLWQLKVNCLHYCRFVHGHHRFEDLAWFPSIRRADPAIGPVIDRLEADHRAVAEHLHAVEHAVSALDATDDRASREALADALGVLGTHLLEHLAYEEQAAGPTLRRMRGI